MATFRCSGGKVLRCTALLGVAILGAILLLQITRRGTPSYSERAETMVMDDQSFGTYTDTEQYKKCMEAMDAAKFILRSIAAKLTGADLSKGGAPIRPAGMNHDSEGRHQRFSVPDMQFHTINGRQLTLEGVRAAVRGGNASPPIPAVLHYFLADDVTSLQAACMSNAVKLMKPIRVFWWGRAGKSAVSGGHHWRELLATAEANGWSRLVVVATFQSQSVSSADLELRKLEALISFGGLLLDPSVYVLRSPRELLRHGVPVLGRNFSDSLATVDQISVDAVLSAPMAVLLFLWRRVVHLAMELAGDADWNYNPSQLLQLLRDSFPDLMHLEPDMYQGKSKKLEYFIRAL